MNRKLFLKFIRKIRTPILKFLSQGDLIVIGDVLTRPDQPALINIPAEAYAEIIGNIISAENNPVCIVPRNYKPTKSNYLYYSPCPPLNKTATILTNPKTL
jgi:hypothetical protein